MRIGIVDTADLANYGRTNEKFGEVLVYDKKREKKKINNILNVDLLFTRVFQK